MPVLKREIGAKVEADMAAVTADAGSLGFELLWLALSCNECEVLGE